MDKITDLRASRWAIPLGLVILVAAAFFIRVQFITIYGGGQDYLDWARVHYFGGITLRYVENASGLVSGHVYPSAAYPPGYPIFLAGVQLFGIDNLQTIRLLQAFIDSLTVLGVYWLLRRLASSRSLALGGTGVYVVFAEWASGSVFLLGEWLAPGLLVWLLVLLVAAKDRTTLWRWSAVGFLIAIGALTRPDLILLIIPAIAWLVLAWKQPKKTKVLGLASLVLCFMLPLGLWGMHNRIHQGEWIFTSTGGGNTLWEGLGDIKNEYGFVLSDTVVARMLAERGLVAHSVLSDKYFGEQYRKALLEHPFYVLKVVAWRWKQIATQAAVAIFSQIFVGVQKLFEEYLNSAALWIWLIAMIISWRKPEAILIAGLPLIYALMSIGLVHYEARYVRYAHLSYLFAPIILLVALPRLLTERGAYWLRWVIGSGALAASLYATASYALYLREVVQIQDLPLLATQGKLTQITDARQMVFQRPVANEVTKEPDGSLSVRTDQSTYGYQLTSQIRLGQAGFLYIPFKANLLHGGFAVGLLGPDQHWLTVKGYTSPGDIDSFIGIKVQGPEHVTLVISNSCAKPCRSEFELKDLKVYVEK